MTRNFHRVFVQVDKQSPSMGERAKERSKKHNANRSATLCSLPVDILGDIVRSLDFQDKCSLELVARSLHALLSSPSAADGLWGRCDLMWDLKLDANFDKKDIIMRYAATFILCSADIYPVCPVRDSSHFL